MQKESILARKILKVMIENFLILKYYTTKEHYNHFYLIFPLKVVKQLKD